MIILYHINSHQCKTVKQKLIEKKLLFYEENMGLYNKSIKLQNIIDKIEDEKIKLDLEGLL